MSPNLLFCRTRELLQCNQIRIIRKEAMAIALQASYNVSTGRGSISTEFNGVGLLVSWITKSAEL
jgi:hypothetical protein